MSEMKCPFSPDKSQLTYGDYLRVEDILKLQNPRSNPPHHDELLFIIIHQSYELWFKLVLHELENSIQYMLKGEVLRAHHFVKRVVEIMKLMIPQIHILETMTPQEFLEFRSQISPASGFQSIQFREIEFIAGLKDQKYVELFANRPEFQERLAARYFAPDLRSAFYEMLRGKGYEIPSNASELERKGDTTVNDQVLAALKPIYQRPGDNETLPTYLLSEALVEFDEYLALWREHHVRVVERVIGYKIGTGGSSGVEYLRSTTTRKCFPLLWEVRTHLEAAK